MMGGGNIIASVESWIMKDLDGVRWKLNITNMAGAKDMLEFDIQRHMD